MALRATGTGQHLSQTSSLSAGDRQTFTACLWVTVNSGPAGSYGTILELGSSAGACAQLYVGQVSAFFRFCLYDGTNFDESSDTLRTRNDGTWFHVALVRSSNVLSLYVNGALVYSLASNAITPGTAWRLLADVTDTYWHDGKAAGLKYFAGAALTADQIAAEMRAVRPVAAVGAARFYPLFDNTLANNARDFAGGQDWTVTGSPTVDDGPPVGWGGRVLRRGPSAAGGGSYTLAADGGTYGLTGTAVNLKYGRKVAGGTGSYAQSGAAVGLKRGYPLAVGSGSIALTGTAVVLRRGYPLAVGAGTYTCTGSAVTLTDSGAGATLSADPGTYSVTGAAVALRRGYPIAAGSGAYTVNGTTTVQSSALTEQQWTTSDAWNPLTVALTGVTAGSLVVTVGGWWNATGSTPIALPTDSNGTLAAAVNPNTTGQSYPVHGQICHVLSAASGTHTITPPAVGNDGDGYLRAFEFAGSGWSLVTTGAAYADGATGSLDAVEVTTAGSAQVGDLVIAVAVIDGDPTSTGLGVPSGAGWTALIETSTSGQNVGLGAAWREVTVAGTQTAAWSWSDATTFQVAAAIAVYRKTNVSIVTLRRGYPLAVGSGAYAHTGAAVSLVRGRPLAVGAGTYSLTGTAVGLIRGRPMAVGSGSYSFVGAAVVLRAGRKVAAGSGTYTHTGSTVALTYSGSGAKVIDVGSGSYAVTGSAVALRAARKAAGGSGTYTVSGSTVALRRSYPLAAGAGSLTLTGAAVALRHAARVAAGSGSYTFTGTAVALAYSGAGDKTLAAGAGSYAVTGTAATLRAARKAAAGAGVYSLSGSAVGLARGYPLAAGSGTYAVTGTAVGFRLDHRIEVGGGAYVLAGTGITLAYSGSVSRTLTGTWEAPTLTGTWEARSLTGTWE